MEISLSPSNEQFLQNKIAEGIYKSINEAINATLNIAISGACISQERLVGRLGIPAQQQLYAIIKL